MKPGFRDASQAKEMSFSLFARGNEVMIVIRFDTGGRQLVNANLGQRA